MEKNIKSYPIKIETLMDNDLSPTSNFIYIVPKTATILNGNQWVALEDENNRIYITTHGDYFRFGRTLDQVSFYSDLRSRGLTATSKSIDIPIKED